MASNSPEWSNEAFYIFNPFYLEVYHVLNLRPSRQEAGRRGSGGYVF